MTAATLDTLVRIITTRRLPLQSEKMLQVALAVELDAAGVAYEREVDLGDGDIIDFMVGDVGVELKIKGQRRAIYRQCERYCRHARVDALLLATNAAMGLPERILGKPVCVVGLGRAWL